MGESFFQFCSLIISIAALCVSIFVCVQNSRTTKLVNRAHVYLYLVSTKNATYIKVKNFGNSNALLLHFDSDVDANKIRKTENVPFPLVGLENIIIAPNTSKIAMIDNKYINSGHWISVTYLDGLTKKQFTHKIDINTYSEYALVHEADFSIIDY